MVNSFFDICLRLFVKGEKRESHSSSVTFHCAVGTALTWSLESVCCSGMAHTNYTQTAPAFLVFAKYFCWFIWDYRKVVAQLIHLTSTLRQFQWSEEAEAVFFKLKSLFKSAPIFSHPNPIRRFIMEVSASDVGIGAVLLQQDSLDQKLYPSTFYSRRLSSAKANYDLGNPELLAVLLALQQWRHWEEGSFIVWTDHKNLA